MSDARYISSLNISTAAADFRSGGTPSESIFLTVSSAWYVSTRSLTSWWLGVISGTIFLSTADVPVHKTLVNTSRFTAS
jgi:hypothetical protein